MKKLSSCEKINNQKMTCILIIVSLGVYLLACCGKREKRRVLVRWKKRYKKGKLQKKSLHRRRARFFFSLSLSLSASHPLSLSCSPITKKPFFFTP